MLNVKRLSAEEADTLVAGAVSKSRELAIPMCIAVADESGQPTFGIHITNNGHFSIIGGGLPVTVAGDIVGGIGISSGTAEQDRVVAEAALDYFLAQSGYHA